MVLFDYGSIAPRCTSSCIALGSRQLFSDWGSCSCCCCYARGGLGEEERGRAELVIDRVESLLHKRPSECFTHHEA